MRSIDRTVARSITLVCLAVGLVGVSYGAIAVASGFPLWLPMVQSVLVLAGSSELLFVGLVAAGGNPVTVALAGLLINARHVPYGLALPPGVTGSRWRRLLGTHVMNDESVVFAFSDGGAAYWRCGLGVLVAWPAGAAAGALIGSVVPDTNAFGLDAMFPAVILALVLPRLRERGTLRAALAGAVIALASTRFLPSGAPVLLALVAVAIAWPARKARDDEG